MAKQTEETGNPAAEAPPAVEANWRQVNRLQLAALLGVHPDTVTDYARSGMPVVTRGGRGKEGVYDAVLCLAWWRDQQGANAKEAAQARAYDASAQLNELKLARERGELVPRDQVVLEGQAFVKAWVTKVRALPRRFTQAGLITRDREPGVTAIVREILEEIAHWRTVADTKRAAGKAA